MRITLALITALMLAAPVLATQPEAEQDLGIRARSPGRRAPGQDQCVEGLEVEGVEPPPEFAGAVVLGDEVIEVGREKTHLISVGCPQPRRGLGAHTLSESRPRANRPWSRRKAHGL